MGLLGSELVFRGGDHLGRENSRLGWSITGIIPCPSLYPYPGGMEKGISLVSFNLGELLQYLQSLGGRPLTSFSACVYFLLKNHYPTKKQRHEASSVGH